MTTAAGPTFTAGYRADGLRAWKAYGGSRTYFLYDRGEPVVELDATGAVSAVNLYAPDGLVGRQMTGGGWAYYLFDADGNVAQRMDASGGVYSATTYDGYGAVAQSPGVAPSDPFGYHAKDGYYTDVETGLAYCQNRYYDPGTGRWMTRDPIGANGGINVYGYCASGPVGSADPSGLMSDKVVAGMELAALDGDAAADAAVDRALIGGSAALAGAGVAAEVEGSAMGAQAQAEAECAGQSIEGASSDEKEPGWYLGQNKAGEPYAGSTTDLPTRISPSHHQLDVSQPVDIFYAEEPVTRRELEIMEQKIINGLGGIEKTGNVRNPVSPKYWPRHGIPPPDTAP